VRYTLADVKASYGPEKAWAEMQGDLPCYLIYRPISFWVALPFLWLGIPVLVMTSFSLVIALSLPAMAYWGGEHAYLGVAGLGFLYHVMDCVDGNMARTLGRTSRLGAILDGTIDMSFWCLLLLSLGLLVDGQAGGFWDGHAVALSLGLAVLLLLNRQTRDNFSLQNRDATYFRSEIPERLSLGDRLMMAVVGLEFVYVFAIALGGWFGGLEWVLLGIAIYVGLMFLGAVGLTWIQAARLDRDPPPQDPR
jgi:phosphatidylglycerophosphate synthase